MAETRIGCVFNNVYHELSEPPYDDMNESDNPYSDDEEY